MKKKLSTILTVLMIAMFAISTADAGGGIKISSNPTFSLGSLIADGFLLGTGQTTVTVVLNATGKCTIITEAGSVEVPVSAIGSQPLSGKEGSKTKNSPLPFHVATLFQDVQSCNNSSELENEIGFVFWKTASISVYSGNVELGRTCTELTFCGGLPSPVIGPDNALLVKQDYNCTTSFDAHTVSCTPVKNNGSNGAVAICHATGSNKNRYVLLTVNANGLNGHGKHTGDIIPAPADGCPR